MVVRVSGPQVVVFSGPDCVVMNDLLCWAVVELGKRGKCLPPRAEQIVEEVRRAAIDFRENTLATPLREHAFDTPGFAAGALDPSDRLSVTEVARLAGVSEQYVRLLARRGTLRGVQSGRGGAWLIEPGSVAVWIAERNLAKAA